MATFEIQEAQNARWVKVTLRDEAVRTERGALNHFFGPLELSTPVPTFRSMVVSAFSEGSLLRPRYRGTGELHLDSSLGGFHVFRVEPGERWILEDGAYWASEDSLSLSVHREKASTAFWAGEGFVWFRTTVTGSGQLVLATRGPVLERELNDERVVFDGRFVIARTAGVNFAIRRPTRSWLGMMISGQRAARVYEGTGKILYSITPFWRLQVLERQKADPAAAMS